MLRKFFFAIAGVLAMAASSQAVSIIDVGNHALLPDTPGQVIEIRVSSPTNDRAGSVDLPFIVGNGGTVLGGTDTAPAITAVSTIAPGTVFGDNNSGQQPDDGSTFFPNFWQTGNITVSGTEPLDPDADGPLTGLLALVTFDTTGYTEGQWLLSLDGTGSALGQLPAAAYGADGFPQVINGTIFIDNGISGHAGDSEDNPILPDSQDGSSWVFTDHPGTDGHETDEGHWYDPPAADGYEYVSTGGTNFIQVGMPTIGDLNGMFKVRAGDGTVAWVAEGAFWDFGGNPQTSFRVSNIYAPVDGGDPTAFPTFIQFDGLNNSFTMTPLPEPSSLVLAVLGMVGLVGLARRRRQA
jgi:hypothetical protein